MLFKSWNQRVVIICLYILAVMICTTFISIYRSIRTVIHRNNIAVPEKNPSKYRNKMYDNITYSFQLLRDLAVKYQEFPFGGEWHIENGNNNWVSDSCVLDNTDNVYQERDDVEQYIKSKRISRIMLLGD